MNCVLRAGFNLGLPPGVHRTVNCTTGTISSRGRGRLRPSRVFDLFGSAFRGIIRPCDVDRIRFRRGRSNVMAQIASAFHKGAVIARTSKGNHLSTMDGTLGGTCRLGCALRACRRRTLRRDSSSGTVTCIKVHGPSKALT